MSEDVVGRPDRVPLDVEAAAGDPRELLGEERCERINGFAAARLAELALPASQSKESSLYVDELQRLLTCLVTLSS